MRMMLVGGLAAMFAMVSGAGAQDRPHPEVASPKVVHLMNATKGEAGEILENVRVVCDPAMKLHLVERRNDIVIEGTAEQEAMAERLIRELDRVDKAYRLTFTVVERDGDRQVGVQHTAMVLVAGQRTVLKQGSKVPLVTGSFEKANGTETQLTYLDVGVNIEATVNEVVGGVSLQMKFERSGVAEEPSAVGKGDPVIRQTVIEGTVELPMGKPVVVGSTDVVGSTRRVEVSVVAEAMR